MTAYELLRALGQADDPFVLQAAPVDDPAPAPQKRRQISARAKRLWIPTLAACLLLLASLSLSRILPAGNSDTSNDGAGAAGDTSDGSTGQDDTGGTDGAQPPDTADGAPFIEVGGTTYLISSHPQSYTLPEGFSPAGEVFLDGTEGPYPYYTHPDIPQWIYVLQPCYDIASQTTFTGYVRYVDASVRGSRRILYQGSLYAPCGTSRGLTEEEQLRFAAAGETYGSRIEGEAPEGFSLVEQTVFTGYDLLPQVEGGSNYHPSGTALYASAKEEDVLLVETSWYTATDQEGGQTRHSGYEVYIRLGP